VVGPVTSDTSLGSLECPHKPPCGRHVTSDTSLGSLDCPHYYTILGITRILSYANFDVAFQKRSISLERIVRVVFIKKSLISLGIYLHKVNYSFGSVTSERSPMQLDRAACSLAPCDACA
jgi:hypothetical protein